MAVTDISPALPRPLPWRRPANKFQLLRRRLGKTSTVLDELEAVYLDSCIEIKSIPRNGFLAYFSEVRGEYFGEISTELIGVGNNVNANAYHVVENESDSSVSKPFLMFEK